MTPGRDSVITIEDVGRQCQITPGASATIPANTIVEGEKIAVSATFTHTFALPPRVRPGVVRLTRGRQWRMVRVDGMSTGFEADDMSVDVFMTPITGWRKTGALRPRRARIARR